MSRDFDAQIREKLSEIEELLRAKVAQVILGSGGPAPRSAARAATAETRPGAKARATGGRRTRGKRTTADIEGQATRLLDYVRSNPGQGVEAIAKGMGTTTRNLALPMTRLRQSKRITMKGNRRAAKYYPTKKTKA